MFDEFWNVWKQALDIVDIKKGENFWNIQKFLSLSLSLYDYYNVS